MLKRIFIFLMALICLATFTTAQTVKVTKHDSTTIVYSTINFKVETPKATKADFMDVTVAKTGFDRLFKNDSVLLTKVAELSDKSSINNKCNSPPALLKAYHNKLFIAYISIVGLLVVSFIYIILSDIQFIHKIVFIATALLIANFLVLSLPEIIGYLTGVYSDA